MVFDQLFDLFFILLRLSPIQILFQFLPMGILVFENNTMFLESLLLGRADLLFHLPRSWDSRLIENSGISISLISSQIRNVMPVLQIEFVSFFGLVDFVPVFFLGVLLDNHFLALFRLILSFPRRQVHREHIIFLVFGDGLCSIEGLLLVYDFV